ncbi:MAG TPA: PAS domain-containing protein [Gemmatimonadaceae bacterium]|nr:MAG: hypothetical protein ABS52_00945 [Gemmatimonadetes bacterium SCN 70-22]HMN07581.1 PAS domain-containing protein [Gemmatimonadaceae bacterium]
MLQASFLLPVVLPALAAGVGIGVLVGRRRGREPTAPSPDESAPTPRRQGDSESLRSQALEAVAEPVLVIGVDGRVKDCNAAALVLLDRNRPAVIDVEATTLRALVTPRAQLQDWKEVIALRAPWSGDAHVRLADGSRRASPVRLVPVFALSGELTAMVEVYRELPSEPELAPDQYLRALDLGEGGDAAGTAGERAERELRLLTLAIADLDRVVRQYELLLPAVRAEDPLAEAIAGLAAETSEVIASADVPRLLRELPATLARLRAQVQRLAEPAGSD